MNTVNTFDEEIGRRLFEDYATSAEAHGADNIAIVFRSREHDDARGNRIEIDFFEDGETVFFRHAEVEQKNIGLQLGKQLDALGAILRFADDGDVLIAINEFAEAIAKDRVIVGHENSNLLFGLRHNLSNSLPKQTSAERNLDRQTRSMARVRLYSQNPIHGSRALLNGNGTQPQTV